MWPVPSAGSLLQGKGSREDSDARRERNVCAVRLPKRMRPGRIYRARGPGGGCTALIGMCSSFVTFTRIASLLARCIWVAKRKMTTYYMDTGR